MRITTLSEILRPILAVSAMLCTAAGGLLAVSQRVDPSLALPVDQHITSAVSGFKWWNLAAACLAVLCFSAGTMPLNDAVDLEADLINRPSRPIPSGRISISRAIGLFAIVSALGGGFSIMLLLRGVIWLPASLSSGFC